jgi:hypothetical protein
MGKKVASFAASPLTGAGGLLGAGGKDLLFGKVEGGVEADPITDHIRAANVKALGFQTEGLDRLKELSKVKGEDMLGRSMDLAKAQEKGFAIQGAADARRRIQEMAARRGMSRSSIPMLSEGTLTTGLANNLGGIEARHVANRPLAIHQFDVQSAQSPFQAALQVSQANPMNVPMQSIAGKRNGGISGLLGAGIGGAMGGPQGAGVGYQAGQGLGGVFG